MIAPDASSDATGPRRRLVLLIGAHKTASSHLQQSIMAAEEALRDRGVVPIPPLTVRRDLTPISAMLRDEVPPPIARGAAQAFLAHHAGDAERVVVMDENILGSTDPKTLLRAKRLYPWGQLRLSRVVDLFPDCEIEIGLGIRNLATFLPSCWGENLFHKPYCDFRTFLGGIDPTLLSWARLLRRLREVAPDARLFVWRYEDYTALMPLLCAQILGPRAAEQIKPLDKIMRPGFSAQAVTHLDSLGTPTRDDIHAARKKFSKAKGAVPFSPWSNAERAALDAHYEADLTALQSIENLRLLRP